MYEDQIESVMRGALLSASKSNNISLQDVRIKMRLNDGHNSTDCVTLNKTEEVGELTWAKVLGLKMVLKGVIVGTITKMILTLSEENSIDKNHVNVRVFAKDMKGTPLLYLFDGGKRIKEVNVSELL
jgi:hypothetical protein